MRYLIIFLLICTSALGSSLNLTCTASDKSYSDNIKIIGSIAIMEWVNGRFLQTGDVTITSDAYIITGDIKNGDLKLGTFRYSINRTTGIFQKNLNYNKTEPSSYYGNCTKTQNKF